MAQEVADRRDVDFVLHEQLEVEQLSRHDHFSEFTRKTVDLIVSEARNLALKELLSCQREADEEGCTFDSGQVTVPKAFHRAYDLFRQGEWIAMCDDPAWGGQGMPRTVAMAAENYFNGANFPFMLHNILIHGAGKLVERFGTDQQKDLYLKNMYTGKWGGSMLLTEPEAGSDVGALTTKAVKNDDGTYRISGSKIFISSGDTDLVKNIIHPVLARIEGAPAGTAGISLFLVPKFRVNKDGTPGEFNDIVCTGIEHKMGIHGSPTCAMTLGGKGACIGTLLGEENKGMRAMFVMMNEARLHVGMQGFACAGASYLNALNYARDRVQGAALTAPKGSSGIPIIQHPDIRRTLLSMKTASEAMRSLLFYVGFLEDKMTLSADKDEKARYQGLIDVLIPVAKGYVTDRAFELCSSGLQVFGGYGYTREYPQEQLLRDCRITQIYEGTNGIQAMDLLGRKLGLNQGQAFMDLVTEVEQTIGAAKKVTELASLADTLETTLNHLKETAGKLAGDLGSKNILTAFAHAHPFLDVTGDTLMGWMLLWRAVIAARKLGDNPKKKDTAFYQGQVTGARFFISTVLPVAQAKMAVIQAGDTSALDMADTAFGS
ncbi:acyl-CoA dehydrogenase [Desulfotignum phosphitoxidans]|uniref:Acyl-CoA dehydrogenase, short-chain specific n=1 Tax=Desulfotignum phosphitoxidans DSM 13687 TaxID=1286635 RepID=S0FW10_9BACT|nr:acyl-CoA dehydrogenase [Desulfotignum phosphitoxidans]EMS78925.1 acyl-CoA dehydrogenase, short-chain specific [Desulfotignum phosphitoxidans DSM 13687]